MMAAGRMANQDNPKLRDLRWLLQLWGAGLWGFIVVAALAGILAISWGKIAFTAQNGPLLMAVTAAAVAIFGHLFSKYADFKKQYIEIENGILDHKHLVRRRLIAFHAEINRNLVNLADHSSEKQRRKFIELVLKDPDRHRFGKADATNPIYDDNRPHLYEFRRPVIEAIIGYYSNLNLAIDALSLTEFKVLGTAQKLHGTSIF